MQGHQVEFFFDGLGFFFFFGLGVSALGATGLPAPSVSGGDASMFDVKKAKGPSVEQSTLLSSRAPSDTGERKPPQKTWGSGDTGVRCLYGSSAAPTTNLCGIQIFNLTSM